MKLQAKSTGKSKPYPFGKPNGQQACIKAHTLPKKLQGTRMNLSINYNTKKVYFIFICT